MTFVDEKNLKSILEKEVLGKKTRGFYKPIMRYYYGVTTAYSSKIWANKAKSAFFRREIGCKIAKAL